MALKYGIFASKKTGTTDDGLPIGDRMNDTAYFARYHSLFLSNGVYGKVSDCGQVKATGSGLDVAIQPIDVLINGWYAYDISVENFTTSEVTQDRIDRYIVQLNLPERLIKVYCKSSTTGVAPELTRTIDLYELSLATITLTKGQTVLSQSNIHDDRLDSNLCGIVTGVINQVGTDTLLAQMEAWFTDKKAVDEADFKHWYDTFTAQSGSDFSTWFAGVKNTLDGDTAGHLLNEINKKLDKSALLDLVFPVGATYSSRKSTSPASLFGGAWQQIKDRFILAAGDTYKVGDKGGSSAEVLTIDEIPAHKHSASKAGFIEQTYGDSTCYTQAPGWDGNYWGVSSYLQTEAAGGGKPHNNMPPYDVFYVWERIS